MSLAKCVANSFHQLKPIKSKLQKASSNNEFNKKIWHSEIEPNFAKVIGKTNVIKPLNKHGEYLIDSKIKVNLIKLCFRSTDGQSFSHPGGQKRFFTEF